MQPSTVPGTSTVPKLERTGASLLEEERVLLVTFLFQKTKTKKQPPPKKNQKPSSELNSWEHTVHRRQLCSANEMKSQKHQELKFIVAHTENTKKADP